MNFALICLASILVLGLVAALTSIGGKDEPIVQGNDCSTCISKTDGSCKIACLMEKQREGTSAEKKKQQDNNQNEESV
jgi:hypothetical protein